MILTKKESRILFFLGSFLKLLAFFLTISCSTKFNSNVKLKDVKKALRIRNISDINRKNSPLLKHRDSIEIDTGKLDKRAMLAKMSKSVESIIKTKWRQNRN